MSGDRSSFQVAMRDGHALSWQLRWEAAIGCYKRAVEEGGEDSSALGALATACYRAGHLGEALRHYQRLIELDAADDIVLARIVEIRLREGDRDELADAYLDLAAFRLRMGQREEAGRAWLDLARALPDDLPAQERLYRAVSQAGDSTMATSIAQTITRLRGERAGRGIDPWVETVPTPQEMPANGSDDPRLGAGAVSMAEEQLEKTVRASRQSIAARQSAAAIDALLGGICKAPSYLPLQELLAEAQCARGAVDQASATLATLAKLYLLRGDAPRAIDVLAKLRDLGSAPLDLWHESLSRLPQVGVQSQASLEVETLARHLLASERGTEAVSLLRALASRVSDPAVAVRLGEALEAMGRTAEALGAYAQALCEDAANATAALRLAVAGSEAGEFQTAVRGLEALVDAVAENPGAAGAAEALAAALRANGQSVELNVALGMVLTQSGDWVRAAGHLKKGADAVGLLGAVARLGLAICTLESEGPEAAVRHLVVLQRLHKERDPALRVGWRWVARESQRVLAELSQRKGDLDKAVAALENVRRLSPDDSRACAKLAEVHFRRGDQSQAVAALETLGDLHEGQGRPEQALLVYRGALQVSQANTALARKVAALCLSLGRQDEALDVLGLVAAAAEAGGMTREAVILLREMIAHSRQSDPALALTLRQRIARLLPDDAEAGQDLISAYLAAGKSNEALAESFQLWRSMLAAGRDGEARGALQQALKVDPWNREALLGLGELCERSEDAAGADRAYRRVLSLDAENGTAKARLEAIERRRLGGA